MSKQETSARPSRITGFSATAVDRNRASIAVSNTLSLLGNRAGNTRLVMMYDCSRSHREGVDFVIPEYVE